MSVFSWLRFLHLLPSSFFFCSCSSFMSLSNKWQREKKVEFLLRRAVFTSPFLSGGLWLLCLTAVSWCWWTSKRHPFPFCSFWISSSLRLISSLSWFTSCCHWFHIIDIIWFSKEASSLTWLNLGFLCLWVPESCGSLSVEALFSLFFLQHSELSFKPRDCGIVLTTASQMLSQKNLYLLNVLHILYYTALRRFQYGDSFRHHF